MFDTNAFVIRGHEKVRTHFQSLRDSADFDTERHLFQRRMDQESEALQRAQEHLSRGTRRAA